MNDFAQVAAELAEYEAFERFRSSRPDLPATERRPQRYARSLKAELLNTGVLIAAATSLANAIETGGPAAPAPKALAVFLPAVSPTLATAIDRLVAEDVDVEICELLQTYAARLALSQRMSASFAETGDGSAGADSRQHVDPEILADAWRRTAGAARAAIEALGSLEQAGDKPPTGEVKVLDLLARAEAGERPCLDPEGRVTIPGWAERRRERRHEMRQDAVARIGADTVRVTIRDASLSGLGLELEREAKVGARVTVRVADGREIAGDVAWADGHRAGIRLDRRLEPGDPLLARGSNRPAKLVPERPA